MKQRITNSGLFLIFMISILILGFLSGCSSGGDDTQNPDGDQPVTDNDLGETGGDEEVVDQTEDDGQEGAEDEPFCTYAEPECAENTDCSGDEKCINTKCVAPIDAENYEFSSRLSYLSRLQVPVEFGGGTETGFDHNKDGDPDDRMGELLTLLRVLMPDTELDISPEIQKSIDKDMTNYLVEYRELPLDMCGPAQVAMLEGEGDLDFDGGRDQSMAERIQGNGVYKVNRGTFAGGYGPGNQLNRAYLAGSKKNDGSVDLVTEADRITFNIALPDGTPFPLNIVNFKMVAPLIDENGKLRSVDRARKLQSVDNEDEFWGVLGGVRVGGYMMIADVADKMQELASDCDCGGLDQTQPVITHEVKDGKIAVSCAQDVSGVNDEPSSNPGDDCVKELYGFVCTNLIPLCVLMENMGQFADIDSNPNDDVEVLDAMSLAMWASFSGAKLDDEEPLAPELIAAGDHYALPLNSPPARFNVTANDSDSISGVPTILEVGTPDNGGQVGVTDDLHKVVYQPAEDFKGFETFTYTIGTDTVQETATVSVKLGYDVPRGVSDEFEVEFNRGPAQLDVLANDYWDTLWHDTYYPDTPITLLTVNNFNEDRITIKGRMSLSEDKLFVIYEPPVYNNVEYSEADIGYYFTDGYIDEHGDPVESKPGYITVNLVLPETVCGDTYYDFWAEECDDSNDDNTDDCLDTCLSATCGDGFLWAGHETCDDGNLDNHDHCLDTCVPATCEDSVTSRDETDVDCGGTFCDPCGDGKTCAMSGDCVSLVCTDSVCQASDCSDGVKNGTETDVDCGGDCQPCDSGKACNENAECRSRICDAGVCKKYNECEDDQLIAWEFYPDDAELWNEMCQDNPCALLDQETTANEYDEDCNGFASDRDGDGWTVEGDDFLGEDKQGDCADTIAEINPWVIDTTGNDMDENCDGIASDRDGDGWTVEGDTYLGEDKQGDCEDTIFEINPGVEDEAGNTVDENCDGIASDKDGDGWTVVGDTYWGADKEGDCEDTIAEINPGMPEIGSNLVDENCDDIIIDRDLDGFGSVDHCIVSEGVLNAEGEPVECSDCDDDNPEVFPGSMHSESIVNTLYYDGDTRLAEFCTDFAANRIQQTVEEKLIDYNCDGYFTDLDGDGWTAYGDPTMGEDKAYDCNDFDPRIRPAGPPPNEFQFPACEAQQDIVNLSSCPDLDFSSIGYSTDRPRCPSDLAGELLYCMDLVDDLGESWGVFVCVPSSHDNYDAPQNPFGFGEVWGPCDFNTVLPGCPSGSYCGSPINYSDDYLQQLNDDYGYDLSEVVHKGMCFPSCGNRCTINPCTDPNKNICTMDGRNPACSCNPGYVDQDDQCVEEQVPD